MKSGSSAYVPQRGDFVWIDLDPTLGHEQAGRRPALVLSDRIYNESSHLITVCPVTSRRKGYTFEISLPDGCPVRGVVLADQLKSMDWTKRNVELIGRASRDVVEGVLELVAVLLRMSHR